LDLSKKVKNLEESSGMIMNSFQKQLEILQKEIKDLKRGYTVKERVAVLQKVTEPTITAKEPIGKMANPWKTVSSKKTDKGTNKSALTVKEVLLQIPQKLQTTEGSAQTSYLQKLKKDIKSAMNPSSLLLNKEKINPDGLITNWTLRIMLNKKGQSFPRQSMVAVIENNTGKAPLSILVISTSTAQILFKEEDLPFFQKLFSSKMIHLVDTKKVDFHQRDIARLAHLYLSGYY
jgi:hypothetical protein